MTTKHSEDNTLNCTKMLGGQTDHADSFSSSDSIILIAPYFGCCAVTNPDNAFQHALCNLQAMWGKKMGVKLCLSINQW